MTLRTTLTLLMVVTAVTAAKSQQEEAGPRATPQTERKELTVDELFQLIESNNKTLQVEKTSVDFAGKGIEAARVARLPDVSARAAVSYNGNVLVTDRDLGNAHGYSAPHLGTNFALEAQQVVYAGGAIDAGIRLAELAKEQAEAGLQLTRQQQRFLALGQYLDLVKLGRRQQVYEENIALTEHLIADLSAKLEQGMVLRNDITRHELQLEQLRLGLRRLLDQQDILNHQLCNQLGLADVRLIPILTTDSCQSAHFILPTSHFSLSTSLSPLMEQARLGTQQSEQQLRLARSEQLPKVALFAANQLNGPYIYDLPPKDVNVNNWYVGVGVNYSLSSLFKQSKRIRQAELGQRRATEALDATAEALDNQMHQAVTLYEQSFAEVVTQHKSAELAQQNYEVVSERYLAQLALVTDMLDASTSRLNAELDEADARINNLFAYYRIKYIAGQL